MVSSPGCSPNLAASPRRRRRPPKPYSAGPRVAPPHAALAARARLPPEGPTSRCTRPPARGGIVPVLLSPEPVQERGLSGIERAPLTPARRVGDGVEGVAVPAGGIAR